MSTLMRQIREFKVPRDAIALWWFGQSWLPTLGAERLALIFPLKTYSDRGIRWSSGSDYGVAPLAPRYGLSRLA